MSFNIEKCLLDRENSSRLGMTTVGTSIESLGEEHLWGDRGSSIDTIVLHFMSDRFRSPANPYDRDSLISIFLEFGVSAHYLILRDGKVLQLVPEENKAWHAGGSIMPEPDNRKAVNDFSIGIEMAGSEMDPFTEAQNKSVKQLIKEIESRHTIKNILGHEHISGERAVELGVRQDCKIDPGPHFNWDRIR